MNVVTERIAGSTMAGVSVAPAIEPTLTYGTWLSTHGPSFMVLSYLEIIAINAAIGVTFMWLSPILKGIYRLLSGNSGKES